MPEQHQPSHEEMPSIFLAAGARLRVRQQIENLRTWALASRLGAVGCAGLAGAGGWVIISKFIDRGHTFAHAVQHNLQPPETPYGGAIVAGFALGLAASAWVLHSKARGLDNTANGYAQTLVQHDLQTAQFPQHQPQAVYLLSSIPPNPQAR